MKSGRISTAKIQRQRMALVGPLLALPFLTFIFWILGGASYNSAGDGKSEKAAGLNVQLPDPSKQKEAMLDKLGFYDAAARDSIKMAQLLKNDPYAQWKENNGKITGKNELQTIIKSNKASRHSSAIGLNNSIAQGKTAVDAEQRLLNKMNELNKVINEPQHNQNKSSLNPPVKAGNIESTQRLEQVMRQADQKQKSSEAGNDPEVEQLNVLMDKVMAIQHSQNIPAKSAPAELTRSLKENFLSASNHNIADSVKEGFYGLNKNNATEKNNGSYAIEATVPEDQLLVNGATIKLRLSQDLYLQSTKVPAGNFLWGRVSLSGERLNVDINKIACDHALYPVHMEVYNTDGLLGIYIPGSITSDAMKQSADNSLQLMQLGSYDPSIGAQATVAGIGAAKNLLSKKVKLIKVVVRSGYKILLTNKNNGQ